uniref:Uncharacterized protein n=1 Tax=Oryza brachyantha TaxID=4533 RepID=J3M4U4_ORYBR
MDPPPLSSLIHLGMEVALSCVRNREPGTSFDNLVTGPCRYPQQNVSEDGSLGVTCRKTRNFTVAGFNLSMAYIYFSSLKIMMAQWQHCELNSIPSEERTKDGRPHAVVKAETIAHTHTDTPLPPGAVADAEIVTA